MADEIHYVTVQTASPRSGSLGSVEEGFYKVEGSVVILTDRNGKPRHTKSGKPIRCAIAPGETARKVGWRLTKENIPNRKAGFNRRIEYPKLVF